jgi:hypothetical protein
MSSANARNAGKPVLEQKATSAPKNPRPKPGVSRAKTGSEAHRRHIKALADAVKSPKGLKTEALIKAAWDVGRFAPPAVCKAWKEAMKEPGSVELTDDPAFGAGCPEGTEKLWRRLKSVCDEPKLSMKFPKEHCAMWLRTPEDGSDERSIIARERFFFPKWAEVSASDRFKLPLEVMRADAEKEPDLAPAIKYAGQLEACIAQGGRARQTVPQAILKPR